MTDYVKDEELLDEEENEDADIDKIVEDSKVPEIPKSNPPAKPVDEPETPGKLKRAGKWIKRKIDKAKRNPLVVGIVSFAAGVGVTLGAEALVNRFSRDDEDEQEPVETEFIDEADEPTDDFVPEEVTVDEPNVEVTVEV